MVKKQMFEWGINLSILGCLALIYLIVTQGKLPDVSISEASLYNFKTIFLSIVLEAMPFLLLGVFISGLLQVFITDRVIRAVIPKNPLLGAFAGTLLGFLLPLCECGMIPIVRRLIKKGMPVHVGVVYLLTGPIINPVVFTATYMAFPFKPEITYARFGLAFAVALFVGLIVYRAWKTNPLRDAEHETSHSHSHLHQQDTSSTWSQRGSKKLTETLSHASDEFFDMGKYLLLGSFITAVIQTSLERASLTAIGQGEISSHLFMAGFAFLLSLCSTADAFVAASFASSFTTGSLITFLVIGPMIDLKGLLMMLSVFKARFVIMITGLTAIAVLLGSFIVERIWF